jgi:hypothetical protein
LIFIVNSPVFHLKLQFVCTPSAARTKCGFTAPNCSFDDFGNVVQSRLTSLSSGKIFNKYFAAFKQDDWFCWQYQMQTFLPTRLKQLS